MPRPARRNASPRRSAPSLSLSIQLHVFETGSPHIERHLAFRDFLRAHPEKARSYEAVKLRSRDQHPDNSHAYSNAKSAWIVATEAEAISFYRDG